MPEIGVKFWLQRRCVLRCVPAASRRMFCPIIPPRRKHPPRLPQLPPLFSHSHPRPTDTTVPTILPQTADAGRSYVDDTLFIGDSNTVRYTMYAE